jgi:hypothetical protein
MPAEFNGSKTPKNGSKNGNKLEVKKKESVIIRK